MSTPAFVREAAAYLHRHPWCQIFIFRNELIEAAVIAGGGRINWGLKSIEVPPATLIVHRNGMRGTRLLDSRWWFAASTEQAEWLQRNKGAARALGLLPGGDRWLPTDELLARVARRG